MVNIFVCTGSAGKLAEFRACLSEGAGPSVEVLGIRELEMSSGLRYVEPSEDSDLFLENAFTKLTAARDFLGRVAAKRNQHPSDLAARILVDDSGLCVPALEFAPGVHSATFGGLPRDDAKNRAALRARIAAAGADRLDAFFVCYVLSAEVAVVAEIDDGTSANAARIERETLERNVHLPLAARACASRTPCGGVSATLGPVSIGFGFCSGLVGLTEQAHIEGAGHGYDAMFYPVGSPNLSFASIPMEAKNAVSHRAEALRGIPRVKRACHSCSP